MTIVFDRTSVQSVLAAAFYFNNNGGEILEVSTLDELPKDFIPIGCQNETNLKEEITHPRQVAVTPDELWLAELVDLPLNAASVLHVFNEYNYAVQCLEAGIKYLVSKELPTGIDVQNYLIDSKDVRSLPREVRYVKVNNTSYKVQLIEVNKVYWPLVERNFTFNDHVNLLLISPETKGKVFKIVSRTKELCSYMVKVCVDLGIGAPYNVLA